jgi:hypothetical protein
MSKLDEELERRFRTSQRPVYVDPSLFTRLVQRRSRRERAKRVSAIAFVFALAAVGAGVFALVSRSDRNGTEPATSGASSYASQPAVGAHLPGVPFPACHVTSTLPFGGYTFYGTAYMFTQGLTESAQCPQDGHAFLALYKKAVLNAKPAIMPIDCNARCEIFGTPDIDANGSAELAIVVRDAGWADSVILYRVEPTSATPFSQIAKVASGVRLPFAFDWGSGGETYRSGASCLTTGRVHQLDIWHANLHGNYWRVVERIMNFDGKELRLDHIERRTVVNTEQMPEGGETDFCGASVTP